MRDEKKIIALYGPHDRFNYGDFLFPIMLEYAINDKSTINYSFEKYSLVNANFTKVGAYKSSNYRKLRRDINNNKIQTVIVTGGECLQATWSNLFSYINPVYNKYFQNKKLRRNRFFRNIPKFLLGGQTENPFIIDKNNYRKEIKVIYNAVGAGNNLRDFQISKMRKADLIALRENESYSFVKNFISNTFLVPDSAIIMSDIYKKGRELQELVVEDYIFFQLSNYKHQNKFIEIAEQLNRISEKTGLRIVLCPIGTAKGHEDHLALQKIETLCSNPNIKLFTINPTIEIIMSLIAHSKLYIGTSLHGVITSQSFGNPYIALNPFQTKLVAYLNTWGVSGYDKVANTDDFEDLSLKALTNSTQLSSEILEKTEYQKKIYYNFIDQVIQTLEK